MTDPRRLRVLVVDDSAVQRQMLTRLLVRDPAIEVAGSASNGIEAVRAVARLRPDVITLDDRMPLMSGLEAARQIMRNTPTPIVMISAATGEDARKLADDALAAGVLAVQGKRALSAAGPSAVTELVKLIKGMAEVRVVRQRRERLADSELQPDEPQPRGRLTPEVVAIGSSTGGPNTLRQILQRLPESFAIPVLVVQHTTLGYADTLVGWLAGSTRLPVRLAGDGETPERGVYIAPTGRHLVVRGRRLGLVEGPPVSLHCPSVNNLFSSVAAEYGARAVGVLLTGMGDDGALGMCEMRKAGALTIAQDEDSSVVFGMPAEAIRLGAAERILPPEQIARVLLEQTSMAPRDGAAWI